MDFQQDAGGSHRAAERQFLGFPHLNEDELEELLSSGNSLPAVEDTLRRILEMEVAEDEDIIS